MTSTMSKTHSMCFFWYINNKKVHKQACDYKTYYKIRQMSVGLFETFFWLRGSNNLFKFKQNLKKI